MDVVIKQAQVTTFAESIPGFPLSRNEPDT